MKKLIFIIITFVLFIFTNCSTPREVKTVKIGTCSDVHLPTMHDSEKRITAFIDSMKIAKLDFIIELGDFGTPAPEYAPFFSIWNSFPGPK